jgi:hypothetical protein
MKMKKLLIQFEYDPERTRWLYRDEKLAGFVLTVMNSVASCHTAGTIPAVTVTEEEQPELATHHAASA